MLGQHHLGKVMLGGDVVWQKHRRGTAFQNLSLESLTHQGVKLKATNQNGNLRFPMHFPAFRRTDWQWYLDRLTFLGDVEISLQSICGQLQADVVDFDMLFPMFHFDHGVPKGYDFRDKLTFIANLPLELALQSLCGLLVADVKDGKDMAFPMVFPEERPTKRAEFLDKLTFLGKDEIVTPVRRHLGIVFFSPIEEEGIDNPECTFWVSTLPGRFYVPKSCPETGIHLTPGIRIEVWDGELSNSWSATAYNIWVNYMQRNLDMDRWRFWIVKSVRHNENVFWDSLIWHMDDDNWGDVTDIITDLVLVGTPGQEGGNRVKINLAGIPI